MRIALLLLLSACSSSRDKRPADSAMPDVSTQADARFFRDGGVPSGWGDPCTRSSYGAVSCSNGTLNGWCVTFHGANVCMPGCEGANYSCPGTEFQEYFEGSECFCVQP